MLGDGPSRVGHVRVVRFAIERLRVRAALEGGQRGRAPCPPPARSSERTALACTLGAPVRWSRSSPECRRPAGFAYRPDTPFVSRPGRYGFTGARKLFSRAARPFAPCQRAAQCALLIFFFSDRQVIGK